MKNLKNHISIPKSLMFGCVVCTLFSILITSCKKKSSNADVLNDIDYSKVKIPDFNADSAYFFVKKQCDFGPRTPMSKSHDNCAAWLEEYLKSICDTVYIQDFNSNLWDGKEVKGRNIIASFNIESTDRVLLCAHWDSRLWADKEEDANLQHQPIIGANDGASGVGVLLEIARLMKGKTIKQGLDIVLFDLEDQGAPNWADTTIEDQTDWCLGSQYWAQHLHIPFYGAKYGVLLDMVGYKDLRFSKEQQSMGYASSIVNNIWNIAEALGYGKVFISSTNSSVMDDHVWVNHYAHIPTIDIVQNSADGDFFPYHHTVKDNIDIIDKHSLEIVGRVLLVSFFASEG